MTFGEFQIKYKNEVAELKLRGEVCDDEVCDAELFIAWLIFCHINTKKDNVN